MSEKFDWVDGTDQEFGSYRIMYSRELASRKICYFAGHSWFREYPEYIHYYLQKITEAGFEIIFISASPIGSHSLLELRKTCSVLIEKENKGADFGNWKVALSLTNYAAGFDTILLSNDSIIGPFFSLNPIYDRFLQSDVDFYGLTRSLQRDEHIQSFFILFKNNVLTSHAWKEFWENLTYYHVKDEIIDNYEIKITKKMMAAGFRYETWSDWHKQLSFSYLQKKVAKNAVLFNHWYAHLLKNNEAFNNSINPCAFYWEELITRFNFPFLKRELLIYPKLNVEYNVFKNWKQTIAKIGYNPDLVSQVLSLGKIKTITESYPFDTVNYDFHYFHARSSVYFTNFFLLFENKTLSNDTVSYLVLTEKNTGKELIFYFHFLTEEALEESIETHSAPFRSNADGKKNICNVLVPYSNEVIPYLNSLSLTATAIFQKEDEYESAIIKFINHSVAITGLWSNGFVPPVVNRIIDISDLRMKRIPVPASTGEDQDMPAESESFFDLLNKYHSEYDALPMWYKKIGQVFKIAMGHKLVKIKVARTGLRVTLRHKNPLAEGSKTDLIKNWYYHEYDVLPSWYKKFGKLIIKKK